jgi:hypothetical protein
VQRPQQSASELAAGVGAVAFDVDLEVGFEQSNAPGVPETPERNDRSDAHRCILVVDARVEVSVGRAEATFAGDLAGRCSHLRVVVPERADDGVVGRGWVDELVAPPPLRFEQVHIVRPFAIAR